MMKRLKIIIFPQYTDQTIPIRTEIAEIFGNYLSKNHEIVSMIKSKRQEKTFVWNKIKFYNLPLLEFIKKALYIIKSEAFDVVYTRDSFFLLLLGYILKKKNGSILMFHIISPVNLLTELFHKWYHPRTIASYIINILILKLMKKVDIILPTSEWMGKYLISLGINKNLIYPLPNGANLDLFKTKSSEFVNEPFIIYIGTMAKERKLEIIIEAVSIVAKEINDVHLLMVGEGDGVPLLKELAKKLKIEKNITFTGLIKYEDVPKYVAKARIGLSPIPPISYYKISSPLKMFEYMCSSRPVIANRGIPAHVKIIKESKCGILVDYTKESFALAIIELINNPERCLKLGLNGRKWIEENRTYEKLAKNLEKEIIRLVKFRKTIS